MDQLDKLDQFFKFKILDLVRYASMNWQDIEGYVVIERRIQQCPGGTQVWYACRPIVVERGQVTGRLVDLNEVEIVPYPTAEEIASANSFSSCSNHGNK